MVEFKNPISVGGLAKHIGVPRQRIYNLINRGILKPDVVGKNYVFSPEYASNIVNYCVFRVRTKMGVRVVFDFI